MSQSKAARGPPVSSRLSKPPPAGPWAGQEKTGNLRQAFRPCGPQCGLCLGRRRLSAGGDAMAMNTVEATRIVAVLDDSLEAMR